MRLHPPKNRSTGPRAQPPAHVRRWAGFTLGRVPSRFYRTYVTQGLLLLCLRLVDFRVRRMHYYLFDFCYFANLALLIFCIWLPRNPVLLKTLYAYSYGPLAWSIPLFRNSLVFHSVDRLTSLFIHIYPPIVMWTVRWTPDTEQFGNVLEEQATWVQLVLVPTLLYAVWGALYYTKVFVVSSRKV